MRVGQFCQIRILNGGFAFVIVLALLEGSRKEFLAG
jgi:hypothetical protein